VQPKPEFAAKERKKHKDFTTGPPSHHFGAASCTEDPDFTKGRKGNEELTEELGT
jgi:hypothetical protein